MPQDIYITRPSCRSCARACCLMAKVWDMTFWLVGLMHNCHLSTSQWRCARPCTSSAPAEYFPQACMRRKGMTLLMTGCRVASSGRLWVAGGQLSHSESSIWRYFALGVACTAQHSKRGYFQPGTAMPTAMLLVTRLQPCSEVRSHVTSAGGGNYCEGG